LFAVILYHGVDSGGRCDRAMTAVDQEYVLSRAPFEQHLDYLARRSVPVCSLAECRTASFCESDGALVPAVLTFDDGDVSCYTTTAPILERFGFRGEFFVVTEWIDRPGFLTRTQLCELAARGHRIQSHSRTHPLLTELDTAAIDEEVMLSKRELEAMVGARVEYFSIPNGAYDARVLDAARRAGYVGVLNSVAGYNHPSRADFLLRRFSARSYTGVGEIAEICERPRYTAVRVACTRTALSAIKYVLGDRYDPLRARLIAHKGRQ